MSLASPLVRCLKLTRSKNILSRFAVPITLVVLNTFLMSTSAEGAFEFYSPFMLPTKISEPALPETMALFHLPSKAQHLWSSIRSIQELQSKDSTQFMNAWNLWLLSSSTETGLVSGESFYGQVSVFQWSRKRNNKEHPWFIQRQTPSFQNIWRHSTTRTSWKYLEFLKTTIENASYHL